MHASVIAFAAGALTRVQVAGEDVIEAGSLNVNGSLRDMIMSMGARSYTGIDLQSGNGVDVVMDAAALPGYMTRAGLVVSTSCLEHAVEWKPALRGMISAIRPGGVFLFTVPSAGFPYHEHPGDWNRFSVESVEGIIKAAGLDIDMLEADPMSPGVFLLARKPSGWEWPDGVAAAWDAAEVTPP